MGTDETEGRIVRTFRCDFDLFEWLEEHNDDIEAQIGRMLTDHAREQEHCDHAEN